MKTMKLKPFSKMKIRPFSENHAVIAALDYDMGRVRIFQIDVPLARKRQEADTEDGAIDDAVGEYMNGNSFYYMSAKKGQPFIIEVEK
jgi:hypothetical protein